MAIPGAPADNVFYAGNLDEAGRVWYAYQSAWLPAVAAGGPASASVWPTRSPPRRAIGACALHFNKELRGAAPEAIAATRDTAMNPAVVDAFALAIRRRRRASRLSRRSGP